MAGHDHSAHDDGWRGDGNHAWHDLAHAVLDIDCAIAAEAAAWLAGARIHRDQTAIERAFNDAGRAGAARIGVRHGIVAYAATGGGIWNPGVRHLRIMTPPLHTRRRIQRNKDVRGGT